MIAAISLRIAAKRCAHGLDVVEGKRDREAGERLRHAGAVGLAVRERAAAGVDEQRIDVAVIAAVELDDLVASGEAARQPDARHRRLGAAVHHPHLFDRRHPAADQFRHLHFERIGNAEADAAAGGLRERHRSPPAAHARGSPAPRCRRSRCIRSHRRPRCWRPAARSTKNGSRPRPRKARTGEFTPPGMSRRARAKSSEERADIAPNVQRSTPNVQPRKHSGFNVE